MADTTDLKPGQYEPGTHPDLPPPPGTVGFIGWIRQNLFSSPMNSVLTIAAILFVIWIVPAVLQWAVFDSTTFGEDRRFCSMQRQSSLMGERAAAVDYAILADKNGSFEARRDSARNLVDASRQSIDLGGSYNPDLVTPEFAALVGSTGFVAFAEDLASSTKDLTAATRKTKLFEPSGPTEMPAEVDAAIAGMDLAAIQAGFATLAPMVDYASRNDGACRSIGLLYH